MEGCHSCGCQKGNTPHGSVSIVGTGPGSPDHMTKAAENAINNADIVVGYKTYLDLIPHLLDKKEVLSSSMMQEVDRCKKAIALAESGKNIAMVCGGDPGIYAMAGLIYELAAASDSEVPIEVIPGIAAVNSCAARLGAPLMHDFCAISLSDLLTPWALIKKRISAAASADFVIALYNPKSKKRTEHIVQARQLILEHRDKGTPVGIVTASTRENEKVTITTLHKLLEAEIGMQSTVIIGNSKTFQWRQVMITPRGYTDKYDLKS